CENIGGDHVKRGDAYAEIENSTFESGDIIRILTLDDPIGDKAHQRYCEVKHILECILDAALLRINETHSQGLEYHAKRLKAMIDNYSLDFHLKCNDITYLLRKNHDVEVLFSNSDKREEAVHALRDEYKNDLDKV
ncbi:6481_t:CDS:2, partial [Funneliformis geosporum]